MFISHNILLAHLKRLRGGPYAKIDLYFEANVIWLFQKRSIFIWLKRKVMISVKMRVWFKVSGIAHFKHLLWLRIFLSHHRRDFQYQHRIWQCHNRPNNRFVVLLEWQNIRCPNMWVWKILLLSSYWFSRFTNLDLIAVNAEFSAKSHSFSLRHIWATSFLAKWEWISPSNSICRWRYNSNRFNLLSSWIIRLKGPLRTGYSPELVVRGSLLTTF